MPIRVAVSVLVRGTMKSLERRSMFTKARYSARCSSSLCLLEALSREFRSEIPWEDLYTDDLAIIAKSLEGCVRRLLTGKNAMESKCREDEDHDLWYGSGPLADFRRVSMCRLSHWRGQQQHLLQRLQVLCAQEIQWA